MSIKIAVSCAANCRNKGIKYICKKKSFDLHKLIGGRYRFSLNLHLAPYPKQLMLYSNYIALTSKIPALFFIKALVLLVLLLLQQNFLLVCITINIGI